MKKATHSRSEYTTMKIPLIIYSIFSLLIITVCFFYFIFNYNAVYNDSTGGGFFPPSFGVKIGHAFIAVIFAVIAIMVKAFFKNGIKILPLILLSIILPYLCYFGNYNSLKSDGSMHHLVDEGGMFRFIVIGDYNFDGINDETYHKTYDERTVSAITGTYKGAVLGVQTTATGIGYSLDTTHCSINTDKSYITLHINKNVEYKNIELEIRLDDEVSPDDMSFFIVDTEDEKELSFTVRDGKTIISFDSDSCKAFQDSSQSEFCEKIIVYRVNKK